MPTGEKTHNKDLPVKLALRREFPAAGAIWLPYCGFGEIMEAMEWDPARVYACDIDADAIAHWNATWPAAHAVVADAAKFRFPAGVEFTCADIDPYSVPYKALAHFLSKARLAPSVVVALTDGANRVRTRAGTPYNFKTHRFEQRASVSGRAQYDDLPGAITEWLASIGWTATRCEQSSPPAGNKANYLLAVVERAAGAAAPAAPAALPPDDVIAEAIKGWAAKERDAFLAWLADPERVLYRQSREASGNPQRPYHAAITRMVKRHDWHGIAARYDAREFAAISPRLTETRIAAIKLVRERIESGEISDHALVTIAGYKGEAAAVAVTGVASVQQQQQQPGLDLPAADRVAVSIAIEAVRRGQPVPDYADYPPLPPAGQYGDG